MPPSRPTPNIIVSLAGLVAVAVVPLLLFGIGVGSLMVDQKKQAIADNLGGMASALQVAVDLELANQFATLRQVVEAGDVTCDNAGSLDDKKMKRLGAHPAWRNLTAIDPETHLVVAASLPLPSPRPTTLAVDAVDEVKRTGRPMVAGAFPGGRLDPNPMLMILAPVIRDGSVCLVLATIMDLQPMSRVFADGGLPASWTGAVLDNHLVIAGRSRDPERFVGMKVTPSLAEQLMGAGGGMFTSINLEGQPLYTVFHRSPTSGFSVALGIPADEVTSPVRRLLMQVVAGGALLALVGLALAALVGRRIVRARTAYEQTILERESRLAALAGELQTILDAAPFAIFKIANRKQEWVNRKAEELLKYKKEEMLGNSTRMYYYDDREYEEFGEKAYSRLANGKDYETVIRLRRRDGVARLMRYIGKAIDPAAVDKGAIWLLEDITDRQEDEARIVQANRQLVDQARLLETAKAEIEQFSYVAAHDLRQPLRMVVSYLSLIEKRLGETLDAELKTYFGFASGGARRMDRLIQDLLAYAQVGTSDGPTAAVDLSAVVSASLNNLSASVAETAAQITVADGLPSVGGNTANLTRLFQTLIGNALQHRHPDRTPVIQIDCRRQDPGWVISVRDNGTGIAAEHRERVFTLFQRLHSEETFKGTGIGLAICKKIVDQIGGRIWIEQAPQEGTIFCILLLPEPE